MKKKITEVTQSLKITQSVFADMNSGIFLTEDLLCIIDPGNLPDEIQALNHLAESNNDIEKYLILTHSHWDHLIGANDFAGASIIAHTNFLETTQGRSEQIILENIHKFDKHFKIQRQWKFSIPNPHIFFNESLILKNGTTELQLMHAPGHTKDQIAIYAPKEQLLWAGDMLSDIEIPYVMHSLLAYEQTLSALEKLKISALIPGHGNATKDESGIKARFFEDRRYLSQLHQAVLSALEENLSIEETVDHITDVQHHCLDENLDAHRLNIESAYLELSHSMESKKFGWNKER